MFKNFCLYLFTQKKKKKTINYEKNFNNITNYIQS